MSIIANNLLQGDEGYNLTNSLRFRGSANAYLNRTPAGVGNRRTFTYSGWLKRGLLDTTYNKYFFSARPSASVRDGFYFGTNQTLSVFANDGSSALLVSSQVFRDISAWYHIVVAIDTTQATASNRIKLYVNGVQVTAFGTATYPSQNYDWAFNNTVIHTISDDAANAPTNLYAFDGYMDEVNFIDGQALTPSSFGSTNALTGVWQPAKYTGTYGTNGFYLPFTDNSALTTSSNVGLGRDYSGNGNYWTTNNISITAGATYDSMTDVPTLTNATTANYCVVSPIAYRTTTPTPTISNGNLTVVCPSASFSSIGASTFGVSSGKWYWETTKTGTSYANTGVALAPFSQTISSSFDFGSESNEYAYVNNGSKFNSNSLTSYGASYTNGDVIGVALDLDNGTLTFYKNNTSQGVAFSSLPSGTYIVGCYDSFNGSGFQFNFGQRPFSYTPPTGFVALNTFNLPNSTIVAGNKQMNAVLYTGDNAASKAITGVGFQPDFVWIKARNIAYSNVLYDVVRGTGNTKNLSSDTTNAEPAFSTNANLSSFDSDGFTIGSTSSTNILNGNTSTYVAWNWKANGTAVTNTAGSISSQVSANTTSGFSIVTYTGTGSAATIGHGLGVAPRMIIAKSRSNTADWDVYHASLGATQVIYLNRTTAAQTNSAFWNNTAPTSTVFSLGNGTDINASGATNVAYCFAQIAGYSAFGSYTGNGSADGPFVFTGFRPRYFILKNITSAQSWSVQDTSRSPYNVASAVLLPNSSSAELTGTDFIDIVSNGFKIRHSSSGNNNNNGDTYIYMAFAEVPFKNSLGR